MEHCPISMRVVKSQLAHSLAALAALAEAGRGARLTDVVAALDAPKSSVQRLLQQLAEEGWVEQDPETGYYRLTVRMAVLGQRYLYTSGIVDATQGVLQTVASKTRELARLTIVDTDRLVWIGSAQGAPSGLMYCPADPARIVSYATANGKAWLATLPEKEANRIAQRDGIEAKKPPADVGPNAMRSLAALKRDLALVRARGYADRRRGRRARRRCDRRRHSRSGQRQDARHDERRRTGRPPDQRAITRRSPTSSPPPRGNWRKSGR